MKIKSSFYNWLLFKRSFASHICFFIASAKKCIFQFENKQSKDINLLPYFAGRQNNLSEGTAWHWIKSSTHLSFLGTEVVAHYKYQNIIFLITIKFYMHFLEIKKVVSGRSYSLGRRKKLLQLFLIYSVS